MINLRRLHINAFFDTITAPLSLALNDWSRLDYFQLGGSWGIQPPHVDLTPFLVVFASRAPTSLHLTHLNIHLQLELSRQNVRVYSFHGIDIANCIRILSQTPFMVRGITTLQLTDNEMETDTAFNLFSILRDLTHLHLVFNNSSRAELLPAVKSIAHQLVTLRLQLGETDLDDPLAIDPHFGEQTRSKVLPFILDLLSIQLLAVRSIEIESKTLLPEIVLAVGPCHPALETIHIHSKFSPVVFADLRIFKSTASQARSIDVVAPLPCGTLSSDVLLLEGEFKTTGTVLRYMEPELSVGV